LDPEANSHFIHPGWLPTAILVNIIAANDTRRRHGRDVAVNAETAITLDQSSDGYYLLNYPDPTALDANIWHTNLQPIEVIDGQHRLYAIDTVEDIEGDYEVPVVIFEHLSQALQAYLFWVINVEPKKINPSLAFDLYPELRRQTWLEQGEGIKVYQEHRAQELTEVLWRHPESPWQRRIELHGARVEGHVSNAAYIRSLMVSFVRRWRSEDDKIGGLFGSIVEKSGGSERVLPWKRTQQAAFLIHAWKKIHDGVKTSKVEWAESCRSAKVDDKGRINPLSLDLAFSGPYTLLSTDQGSRVIMNILNAMFFVRYAELELENWESPFPSDSIVDEDVSIALKQLEKMNPINKYLEGIAVALFYGDLDWRTSSAPGLTEEQRQLQSAYRGSSGYSMLQTRALQALVRARNSDISDAAKDVVARLSK
jgi:hypothetical protein